MPRLSRSAAHIVQSEIRIMSVECDKVRGVNLAQGICDTEVPEPVRRGAQRAIDGGLNSYTRLDGIADLRRAIAQKMERENGVAFDPEREVVVTVGSTGAFYSACIALLPGMRERTITISGFSKTFSITGWRVGYAACDQRWAGAIGYFHDLAYICAPSVLQHGVAAGLRELSDDFYGALAKEYLAKRNVLCAALRAAGLEPCVPQGSYYVLADASRLPGRNSKERAMFLLRETGVASVPGAAFYHDPTGETLLRFCFAKTDAELQQACQRLEKLSLAAAAR